MRAPGRGHRVISTIDLLSFTIEYLFFKQLLRKHLAIIPCFLNGEPKFETLRPTHRNAKSLYVVKLWSMDLILMTHCSSQFAINSCHVSNRPSASFFQESFLARPAEPIRVAPAELVV